MLLGSVCYPNNLFSLMSYVIEFGVLWWLQPPKTAVPERRLSMDLAGKSAEQLKREA